MTTEVTNVRAALLFGCAALTALGFGIVSDRVRRQRTAKSDKGARRALRRMYATLSWKQRKLVTLCARAAQPLGKWYGHLPLALATGYTLERRGRGAAAATVVGASAGAIVLSRAIERILPHRPPPPERHEPWEQSYPSGHSFETTAVAMAGGYVLVREGLWRPWTALPLALAAAASGVGKFATHRHWASDLVGGYCAGIALGSACAGAYELSRA